jgi:hypothetical protein
MKRIAISLAFLLPLLVCNAQDSERAILEISGGPSYPIGEFGYNQIAYETSGFAGNGIALTVSFHYRLQAQFGLVASITEYILKVDEINIAKKYWLPEYGFNWTVESTYWLSNAYMAGIDLILPVHESDFYFRLLGGLAGTSLPGLTGSSNDFLREKTTTFAAALNIGMGLSYPIYKKITLSLGTDFFTTYPVLDEIWSSDISSFSSKTKQTITLFNLRLGVGFRIF